MGYLTLFNIGRRMMKIKFTRSSILEDLPYLLNDRAS